MGKNEVTDTSVSTTKWDSLMKTLQILDGIYTNKYRVLTYAINLVVEHIYKSHLQTLNESVYNLAKGLLKGNTLKRYQKTGSHWKGASAKTVDFNYRDQELYFTMMKPVSYLWVTFPGSNMLSEICT